MQIKFKELELKNRELELKYLDLKLKQDKKDIKISGEC